MRNSRGGLGGIPSPGRADAPPASARSRQVKARGQVCGRKGRPFRQRVIAASRTLTLSNSTPNRSRRYEITAFAYAPTAWGWPTTFSGGRSPVEGGNGGHVEMAETLIS